MLSRVASSIYWMTRYIERADNVARFIDVNANLILDMGWERGTSQWLPLISASGDDEDFLKRYSEANEENVVQFLTFDKDNPNSIRECIRSARENARTLREIITTEMWETINTLYHYVEKHSRKRSLDNLQEFYKHIHNNTHIFSGLMESTMSHGEAWHFARMGTYLERADKTTRMFDVKYFLLLPDSEHVDSPHDSVEWSAVLKSVSGFEMYCKQYHRANYRDVTQFLILDKFFPRSIQFCIKEASQSLDQITEMLGVSVPVTKEFRTLIESLEDSERDKILNDGLHQYIDVIQFNLNVIDESLYHSFFFMKN